MKLETTESATSTSPIRAALRWLSLARPSSARPAAQLAASRAAAPPAVEIEPGLLAIYRLFITIHLSLAVGYILLGLLFDAFPRPDSTDFVMASWLATLLVYLYLPTFYLRLGRAYLPIALGFGALMPLVVRYLATHPARMAALGDEGQYLALSSSWQLFLALLIPLLLIGWQYSFRVVLGYVIATTFVDLSILYINGMLGDLRLELGGITFSRTIIFLFTGYIVTRLMHAQRAQRRTLAIANQQLRHYAATAEQLAISRERNRLARELHDTLAHTLSAISVQLEAVDSVWEQAPERARDILHKSLASTRSGLTETRRALQSLRAAPLEDLGLTLALRNLAESSASRAGATLELRLPPDIDNLAPDVEQTLYRIAQEALSNIVKHAAATRITLAVGENNGLITLQVQDNGRGFDASQAEQPGHYGLSGMRERAELLGGKLWLESAPGVGTLVLTELPHP